MTTVLAAVALACAMGVPNATASEPSNTVEVAQPVSQQNSSDLDQIEIAMGYVDYSGSTPTFDRASAESAGLNPGFAQEFEIEFNNQQARAQNSGQALQQPQSTLLPDWANCAIAIAGLSVATVGAVAGLFASGGTLALALASYGVSPLPHVNTSGKVRTLPHLLSSAGWGRSRRC